MKTSTRIVLPFFHALMEAYAYNSENDSEEHRKTEQKSSECNHNTNQILETLSPNITRRYNPQNEMFRLLGTKRSFSQNETFFFSHP